MTGDPTSRDLAQSLQAAGVADVSDSTLDRALMSSDASLYRVVPQVVARPRHTDEIAAVLDVARTHGTSVTMRGSGTSIAGNAVGPGIVVDVGRHLRRIHEIDAEAGTARIDPGVIHAQLQREALPLGWRFGPDPSTHTRCTIGGMVGNNACGSRALGYGRTSDNVVGMRALLGTGEVLVAGSYGRGLSSGAACGALTELADTHLAHIRTHFDRFSRQVSGYALEHLLPEQDRRLDRFLVGSEGTLGLVTDLTVRLVRDAPVRTLIVLGYPSMPEAADAVPALLAHPLVACEGLDSRIVDLVRARGRVPELPRGTGWLFAEVTGETVAETQAVARGVIADAGALDHRVVTDAAEAAALWKIREEGAGLAARSLATPAYSGWEDAAVPPQRLGAWLRDFDDLLDEHGLGGVPYGHFGDGCLHVRIDFTFDDGGTRFRNFLTDASRALAMHGGSLSGEHGDGRARSELLPLMYDAQSIALFGAVKQICDPDNLLNPGVLVDPDPVDGFLRPARPRHEPRTSLRLIHDHGSLADAVHRCTGVGKCIAGPGPGAVMCPSYAATREEKDSTRGRARVLQEALDGELVQGLRDPAVGEALDLCLSCKGCASDCPTGVDMATYKSEVLHQTYAGRRRPRSHYTLGRLPQWLARGSLAAPALNASLKFAPTARVAKWVAGVDQRRSLPQIARRSLRRLVTEERPAVAEQPDVWIWADTFTDHLAPTSGIAAIELLAAAGLTARVIDEPACCALTWITTGQLDQARQMMGRTVATLAPYVASGTPVIGLEPSCLATLRSDAVELLDDPRAADVAAGVSTLAELLTSLSERQGWAPPDLTGVEVVAQPHCHQASIMGWQADRALLERAGARVTQVGGCCGLAGNFGVEKGHYEVSVAVAETNLLPAIRQQPNAVVLADGLSCRTQLADLEEIPAMHLAELLASRIEA